jgi:hypothetical protein
MNQVAASSKPTMQANSRMPQRTNQGGRWLSRAIYPSSVAGTAKGRVWLSAWLIMSMSLVAKFQLIFYEFVIFSFLSYQGFVGTLFGYFALVHHHYFIGMPYRTEAMRYHYHRFFGKKAPQVLQYHFLIVGIE